MLVGLQLNIPSVLLSRNEHLSKDYGATAVNAAQGGARRLWDQVVPGGRLGEPAIVPEKSSGPAVRGAGVVGYGGLRPTSTGRDMIFKLLLASLLLV